MALNFFQSILSTTQPNIISYNSAMVAMEVSKKMGVWKSWPIEIDDLPMTFCDFPWPC